MAVRETSQEAYDELQKSGVLSQQRWEAYDWLFNNGPATSGEFLAWRGRTYGKTMVMDQSRAHFTHLRDAGLFQEVGTRPCRITGKRCIEWDVTARKAPLKAERKTGKQKLVEARQRIKQLEAQIEAMESDGILCPGCYLNGDIKGLPREVLEKAKALGKGMSCDDCGTRIEVA